MITETFSFVGQYRPSIPMDPSAILDYTFDWTDWLTGIGDTIATRTITATNVQVPTSSVNGMLVTVWAHSGVPGSVASITCRITTAGGRQDERTIYLLVQER